MVMSGAPYSSNLNYLAALKRRYFGWGKWWIPQIGPGYRDKHTHLALELRDLLMMVGLDNADQKMDLKIASRPPTAISPGLG